jgi:hypothetical protein
MLIRQPRVMDGVCIVFVGILTVAPAWYNGYRFVLTFIVCTSIVFNLIVKEYLQDTNVHGKLDNLKSQRHNLHGAEFADKVEESGKQK